MNKTRHDSLQLKFDFKKPPDFNQIKNNVYAEHVIYRSKGGRVGSAGLPVIIPRLLSRGCWDEDGEARCVYGSAARRRAAVHRQRMVVKARNASNNGIALHCRAVGNGGWEGSGPLRF